MKFKIKARENREHISSLEKANTISALFKKDPNNKILKLAFWNWYWQSFDDKASMIITVSEWEGGFKNPINVKILETILKGSWGQLNEICADEIGGEFWFEAETKNEIDSLARIYDKYIDFGGKI